MQSVNDAIKHATQDNCKHYFPPTKSPTMDFIAHGMLKQCIYCGKPYRAHGFIVPRRFNSRKATSVIYSTAGKPIEILRIATPADVVDIGKSDPGVYRASRAPGRVTLVVQDRKTGTLSLVNQGQLAKFKQNPMEMAERMNEILGSRDGG